MLLGVDFCETASVSTGALGDWYGNWLPTSIGPLVVLMNGPTRLAVLSTARTVEALVRDMRQHLARLLHKIGVPADAARTQIESLFPVVFAKTLERTLIGSMNEVCRAVAFDDEDRGLSAPNGIIEAEERLIDFVHLKLPETMPIHAVRGRLGGADPRPH